MVVGPVKFGRLLCEFAFVEGAFREADGECRELVCAYMPCCQGGDNGGINPSASRLSG